MDINVLSYVNYGAVAVSSIVFFILGSVWFSGLFGTMWVDELKHHNVTIKQPKPYDLFIKMVLTFVANIVTSFGMASLVIATGSMTVQSGFILGT